MQTRYYICSPKRAEAWGTDNVILGQCHNDDWVDFDIANQYLYNSWITEKHAREYIKQYELEDCEVIELKYRI